MGLTTTGVGVGMGVAVGVGVGMGVAVDVGVGMGVAVDVGVGVGMGVAVGVGVAVAGIALPPPTGGLEGESVAVGVGVGVGVSGAGLLRPGGVPPSLSLMVKMIFSPINRAGTETGIMTSSSPSASESSET